MNSGGAVDVTCPSDAVTPMNTVVEAVASGDRVETGSWVARLEVIVMICVEANDLDVVPPIDACDVTGEPLVGLTLPRDDCVAVRVRICVLEAVAEGTTVTVSEAVAEGVSEGVAEMR